MKYYNIEGTELEVSSIIMGCMRINALSKKELNQLVSEAIELGINYFDHADVYAMGECERLFADAVTMNADLREKMIIQGKCGICKTGGKAYYDFSKEYILKCADEILERLKLDYLDVLLLHRPDSLMEPEEVAEAFDILKASGKVRYFGVSNANSMQIEMLQRQCNEKLLFNQIQLGVGHTLMIDSGMAANTKFAQGADRTGYLLEYARINHLKLQAWSPLQYGMFEGVVLDNPKYEELNHTLQVLAEQYGVSKATIAIAWLLRHPAKMQVISGSTKINHIADYCKATEIELTRAEWYEIYQAGGNIIP